MSEKSASRISVLIASNLKPAKDTRAYGKLGLSLRESGQYRLSFMGSSQIPLENCEHEKFYLAAARTNAVWGRLSSQLRFLRVLFLVRPKILICCTPEFLPIASFLKGLFDYKLVYDVQENYVRNLDLNPTLKAYKKAILSRVIRTMEQVNGIDYYLFAEKCYAEEMPEKTPFLILENKFAGEITARDPIRFKKREGYNFLISGTLTPAFGTLEAINWFKEILREYPASTLKIIGHCTVPSFAAALKNACKNSSQIQLNSSPFPIDHGEILAEYPVVDFAILAYQNREAIKNKYPTKLFESAALGVPVLIGGNPIWLDFLAPFSGGFAIDFFNLDQAVLQFQSALSKEYFAHNVGDSVLWKSQHTEFISLINSL